MTLLTPQDLSVVIPSKGRPTQAKRLVDVMLPTATVCVAESDLDEYLAAGLPQQKLWTHPDLFGLAKIRNWVVQHSKSPITIQIDDDVTGVDAWPGVKKRTYRDPSSVLQIILNTAQCAKDAGARLFCWGNHGKPLYFKPHDPFGFDDPVSRALGTIGKDVKWDERLVTMVDADASLQELLTARIVFCDERFYFQAGRVFGNAGGMQSIRTNELRERDRRLLKAKWGQYLEIDKKSKTGQSINSIRVQRRQTF